jgi:hypothetical protein
MRFRTELGESGAPKDKEEASFLKERSKELLLF